jgi:16S rRNA (guanine527-N7)-methyltransferase
VNQREFSQRLRRRAKRAGAPLSEQLTANLWLYFDLLFRWNAKINLTSLSLEHPDEAIDRLLVEPLLAARHDLAGRACRVLDVGSGGGSPAIPLKLAAPDIGLVMVEAKARKSAFLREVLRQLRIDGTVETARFEELLARPEFHEAFDVATLRAVRADSKTMLRVQAFVRPGGRIFLFRGSGTTDRFGWIVPPLQRLGAHPLGDGAQLIILDKMAIP